MVNSTSENDYKGFFEGIPLKVAEIINGNHFKRKYYKNKVQEARKRHELVEWAHWYYQITDRPLYQPNIKLTNKEKLLAAYYILAYLRDVIGNFLKQDWLVEHDDVEFAEAVLLRSEILEPIAVDPRASKARLEEALVNVKSDIETKIKTASGGKAGDEKPAGMEQKQEDINKPNSKTRKIFGETINFHGIQINYKNLWHKIKNQPFVAKIIKTIKRLLTTK